MSAVNRQETTSGKLHKKHRNPTGLIFTLICAAGVFYPFFIMLTGSVKSTKEALISPNSLPTEIHLENFVKAWISMDFTRVLANTVFITVLSVAGGIIFTAFAAYPIGLSRHRKFYNFLYYLFLCGIMIPFYTALVPLVKLMNDLHMTNSLFGMVVYYVGRRMPMNVFLYVGFVRGVSSEILEAGEIDGAGLWKLFWKILFPLMKPITVTIMLLDSMATWNDFLMPKIMLSTKVNRTITLAQYFFRSENNNKWELTFAAYILTLLPIMIFYFAFQKNIVKGVAAGAVKG